MLSLCDNQVLLKAVKRWEGRRRKSEVSRSARRRHFTGSNWRALKKNNSRSNEVSGQSERTSRKSCQAANEEANIQADNAISSKDVPTEWRDRTNRAVFTRQEPRRKGGTVSYEDYSPSLWPTEPRLHVRSRRKPAKRWKTTSRCKLSPEYGNCFTTWYMDGWREIQKDLYQGEGKKGRHPPAFLRHMGSGLHTETECRKDYDGKIIEWYTNSKSNRRAPKLEKNNNRSSDVSGQSERASSRTCKWRSQHPRR